MHRLLGTLHGLTACLGEWFTPRLFEPSLAGLDLSGCSRRASVADTTEHFGVNAPLDYALPAHQQRMPEDHPIHIDPAQSQFRSEYEQELESWLRRRFRLVCLCYLVLAATVMGLRLWIGFGPGEGRTLAIIANAAAGVLSLAVVSYFYFGRAWEHARREQLIHSASMLILLLGVISLAKNSIIVQATSREENFLLPLFFWHFVACTLLPWTPRESLRPIVPLLALWMLGVLFLEQATVVERVIKITFAPGILVPGLAWCAVRLKHHGERFRMQMVGKQFFSMRREIAEARTIHENLFPQPFDDGFVRFEYTYAPQRELGGDYVHLHTSPSPSHSVYVTLLDVTGHGLAAALTVNRLYGELERIFGESPDAEPVDVLSLLNRYIHLTMVRHNIYVTALCMRVDPSAGTIVWSSAGHPPALLRGANGVVQKLAATNVLLGALDGSEFKGVQAERELSPGDAILMYTDGAFEARNREGRMLGLEQIDSLAHTQPPPRRWPQFIAAAVQKHTAGRAEDDILVATLTYLAPRPARVRQSEIPTRAF